MLALGVAIGTASHAAPGREQSLYARLGGQDGMLAIVSDLIDRVATDPRTGHHFAGVNLSRAKSGLAEFLCAATGGQCSYVESLETIHRGMGVNALEFEVTTQHLREVLDARVEAADRDALLQLLGQLQPQIVTP